MLRRAAFSAIALTLLLAGCASSREEGRFYTGAYGGLSAGGAQGR